MKHSRASACTLSLAITIFCLSSFAQQSAGEKALANKNWSAAEKLFRAELQENGKNGSAWFGLGEALYGEQKFADSADAFKKAAAENFESLRSQFREAKSLARAGESSKAFEALTELNRQGFPNLHALTSEDDFQPLQSDKRWQEIVAATDANANPCEHTPENRQFDFWIGEWDVQTTNGHPAGSSKVDRILNGCALLENWRGAGDGKSLNIYNANRKQWQQFWVDSGGEVHEYAGGLLNGEMRFEGPASDHDGKRSMRRMTFTRLDGGRVRQKGEVSEDGANWSDEYELIYVPKSGASSVSK